MKKEYDTCKSCRYSLPAELVKKQEEDPDLDEKLDISDFVHCALTKTYMYGNDYCSRHPTLIKKMKEWQEKQSGKKVAHERS